MYRLNVLREYCSGSSIKISIDQSSSVGGGGVGPGETF